jgi:N-acetylmuramic acid 6-phosphate etherase
MHHLVTEQPNATSAEIDTLSTIQIVELMNNEDQKVAAAVALESKAIATAVDAIAARVATGGRLIYLGAGTSGRLGVLDASECPPTFNTPPSMVVGIIAGGTKALTNAIEGAEDDSAAAISDLQSHAFSSRDVLVGIATSGRTPYVISGLRYAQEMGAFAIGLSCNPNSELNLCSDVVIAPIVGPEVISGSTRLKAGTATKMVLNILTTATMVRLGKTFGNWMVDLRATNIKLKARSVRIVSAITGLSEEQAAEQLNRCNGEVKTAIVASKQSVEPSDARQLLTRTAGRLRDALKLNVVDDDRQTS